MDGFMPLVIVLAANVRVLDANEPSREVDEYVFRYPRLLATYTYGLVFLVLGNPAGHTVYIGRTLCLR